MTIFDLIALLITVLIVVILLFFGVVWKLLDDIKEWLKSICDKLCSTHADMYDDVGNHYLVEILNKLDNIENNILDDLRDIRIADKCISDLAINVKGNYNTLERQQEDIGYIRTRINHILSLLHPVEEVVKPDGPTALDGLSNVQNDNANKSINYNSYDPTIIVRGSETTNKGK